VQAPALIVVHSTDNPPVEAPKGTSPMYHLRRTSTVMAGLVTAIVGVIAAAPAAFAMRLNEPEGASGLIPTTTTVAHHGLAGWEITLIVVAVLAVATVAAVAVRARTTVRALAS
jgi:hypothetical protein